MKQSKQIKIVLLISIIINIFFLTIMLWPTSMDTDARIERVEHLMNYSRYYYNSAQFGIDENMTISEIRNFYKYSGHRTYIRMGSTLIIDYVCDGRNSFMIEEMLE